MKTKPATHPTAATTVQQAKQFAESVATIVHEKLRTLNERQLVAHLHALRDSVEFQLWIEWMELDSLAGPEPHETEAAH